MTTFIIYHTYGADDQHRHLNEEGLLVYGDFVTTEQVKAEREYFRHSKIRHDDMLFGVVWLYQINGPMDAQFDDQTNKATYLTDKTHFGAREQDPERHQKIWATPLEGWTKPDESMIRGLLKAAGLTQLEAAKQIGISVQHLGRYLSGKTPITFAVWNVLLDLNGFKRWG